MIDGREIALVAARVGDEKKAEEIVIYDLRGLSDITDYLVIATALSKAQIRAVIEGVKKDLKAQGVLKLGQEGNENGQWVLLDYGDCVIHIFSPQLREYYALESLWGDAPKVDWTKSLPAAH